MSSQSLLLVVSLCLLVNGARAFLPTGLYMSVQQHHQPSPLTSRRAAIKGGIAALSGAAVSALALPQLASAAQTKSKSGYDLTPMSKEEVKQAVAGLSELQKKVLLEAGTERAFSGKTVNGYSHDTKEKGTWVSAASGVPLFDSSAKYDSGTGWPSFSKVIDPSHVIERVDPKDLGFPSFMVRTEVLDRRSGTHIGHVFPDGPKPTGLRYCMNAAALRFVPEGEPLPVQASAQ